MSQRHAVVSNAKIVAFLRSVVSGRAVLLGILAVLLLVYLMTLQVQVGEVQVYLLFVGLLLHYFIFSRQISIPFLYTMLFCAILTPLFAFNTLVGVCLFFAGLAYFFHHTLQDEEWFHVAPLVVFYAGVVVHAVLFTPLLLGDASGYFSQLAAYESVTEYVRTFASLIVAHPIWIGNFTQKFPVVYLPFYFSLDLTSPIFIVVINGTLWTLSTLMLTKLSVEHVYERFERFSSRLFFVLLLVSPTVMLYASQFAKEIATLFFMVLAVYLFFEGRYLSFCLAALMAFYLRPYIIVAILVYVFLFRGNLIPMALVALTALLVLAVDTVSAVAITNGIVIFPYMFLSPLPFDVSNWMNIRAGLRPLEAIFTGGAAVVGAYVFLVGREYRTEYILLGLGLLAWALTLSWVGFDRVQGGNFEGPTYDFLVFGVHAVRKKMPVMPLLVAWVVLTVGGVRDYLVNVRFEWD